MSLTFSVIICCYTLDRWQQLCEAVESARGQTMPPIEVLVCCDHNAHLAARCRDRWATDTVVRVLENRYEGRLGSARNSAVEVAVGDVLAFLDDDACAEPDWLERLRGVYEEDPVVQAVGGAPRPIFETSRPAWFPLEFDWVFGCAYRGLPTARARTRRLIGACMSARRAAVLEVEGFHSDNHDDMDLCHRLTHEYGGDCVVFDPQIRVGHNVTAERVSWSYFWRRCMRVNRGKVLAVSDMGAAGSHDADLDFVRSVLVDAVPRYLRSPTGGGWLRIGATIVGLGCALLGNLEGHVELLLGMTPPSLTRGLGGDPRQPERPPLAPSR